MTKRMRLVLAMATGCNRQGPEAPRAVDQTMASVPVRVPVRPSRIAISRLTVCPLMANTRSLC